MNGALIYLMHRITKRKLATCLVFCSLADPAAYIEKRGHHYKGLLSHFYINVISKYPRSKPHPLSMVHNTM